MYYFLKLGGRGASSYRNKQKKPPKSSSKNLYTKFQSSGSSQRGVTYAKNKFKTLEKPTKKYIFETVSGFSKVERLKPTKCALKTCPESTYQTSVSQFNLEGHYARNKLKTEEKATKKITF